MSRDRDWLLDVIEPIGLVRDHSTAGRAVLEDAVTNAALLRWLGVIGEATAQLSPAIRGAHDEVPWSDVIGMRNILIHAYRRIEPDLVWQAVERLPELEVQVRAILDQLPE